MPDEPEDPINLEERRKQAARDAFKERYLKPAFGPLKAMADIRREQMDQMGALFGLPQPYPYKILTHLLFASQEGYGSEPPPFKFLSDIGWLWRGYVLARDTADRVEHHAEHSKRVGRPPLYPDWPAHAAKVDDDAGEAYDNLAEHGYSEMQAFFGVPNKEHAELCTIVEGLLQFAEYRGEMCSATYWMLVQAIIAACQENARKEG